VSEEQATGVTEPGGDPQGATGADGNQAEKDRGDYLTRVRTDPEFAAEEVRKKDRKVSELTEELRRREERYAVIEPYLDNVGGGERFVELAGKGSVVELNPALQSVYDTFQKTGQLPAVDPQGADPDDGDDFLDPDTKALKDALRRSEERTAALEQRLAGAETRGFQSDIDRKLEEFASLWPKDCQAGALEVVKQGVKDAMAKAQRGDPNGTYTLQQLSGENGVHTMELLTQPYLRKNLKAIAEAEESAAAGGLAEHATAPRSTASTTGEAAGPPKGEEKLPVGAQWLRSIARNTEKLGHTKEIWDRGP
jgi:hypothetical protein